MLPALRPSGVRTLDVERSCRLAVSKGFAGIVARVGDVLIVNEIETTENARQRQVKLLFGEYQAFG